MLNDIKYSQVLFTRPLIAQLLCTEAAMRLRKTYHFGKSFLPPAQCDESVRVS